MASALLTTAVFYSLYQSVPSILSVFFSFGERIIILKDSSAYYDDVSSSLNNCYFGSVVLLTQMIRSLTHLYARCEVQHVWIRVVQPRLSDNSIGIGVRFGHCHALLGIFFRGHVPFGAHLCHHNGFAF